MHPYGNDHTEQEVIELLTLIRKGQIAAAQWRAAQFVVLVGILIAVIQGH